MINKFVILTRPRSASEFLIATLSKCVTSCNYPTEETSEVLNTCISKLVIPKATRFTYFQDKFGRDPIDNQEILQHAIEIQKKYFEKYDIAKVFTTEWSIPRDNPYWDWLKNNQDIKIIHLIRQNVLRRHVSELISTKTGIWHTTTPLKITKIDVDVSWFFNYIIENKEDQWAKETFKRAYTIYYDDIIKDIKNSIRNLLSWSNELIGVLEISNLKPTNPFDLRLIINNYDEVYSALKNTEHFWMLET